MKKLLLTLTISCYATVCLGQTTNYYYGVDYGTTFSWTDENGKTITYIYKGELYNKDSKYIGTPWIPKDGSSKSELLRGWPNLLQDMSSDMNINNIVEVAYSVIPDKYKPALKHGRFAGTFYFDSETGELADVEFSFDDDSGFAYIPPEIYYEIEKALKNCGFKVVPSAVGRRMNYLLHGWSTFIDGRID